MRLVVEIKYKNDVMQRFAEAVGNAGRKMSAELAVAVNATARKTKSLMAKEVTKELAVAQKVVKEQITQPRKAKAAQPIAAVQLRKSDRIPLRDFGARQNKTGVSYRISKRTGRRTIPGAFVVASIGGHVFRRGGKFAAAKKGRYVGRRRENIIKLFGPSPLGVYAKQKAQKPVLLGTQEELGKQVERRIRFLLLKASGTI